MSAVNLIETEAPATRLFTQPVACPRCGGPLTWLSYRNLSDSLPCTASLTKLSCHPCGNAYEVEVTLRDAVPAPQVGPDDTLLEVELLRSRLPECHWRRELLVKHMRTNFGWGRGKTLRLLAVVEKDVSS